MVLGSEAYTASRAFYNSVKGAAKAGEPGSDTIHKDLGARFKKQFSQEDQEQEEPQA